MSATLSLHPTGYTPAADALAERPMRAVEECPLCGESRRTLVHRLSDPSGRLPGTFTLHRCAGCGLAYVDPRPSDDALTALYDQDFYFSTGWSYQRLAAWTIERIQAGRRRRIAGRLRPGRLLDIGCGDGHFVDHMARHGWDATGIDFSSAAILRAGALGGPGRFRCGTLDDFALAGGRFDAITMWQVLEHIGEPRPLLARCHDLLGRGGLLVASVPNLDGWSARLTRARWWGLDVPRHLVMYTPATLTTALERAGFGVVRMRHRSLQYDPYALLHSSLDWVFTRRHFLSDLAKRQAVDGIARPEFVANVVALITLAPLLAPLALVTTTVAAWAGHGGFIEAHARRD